MRGNYGFQGDDTGNPIGQFPARHRRPAPAELNIDSVAAAHGVHPIPDAVLTSGADDEAMIGVGPVGTQFDHPCQGYVPMAAEMIHYMGRIIQRR
ncbi:hypothetical protein GCM10022629_65490 [Amorphoplanes auranticolor]